MYKKCTVSNSRLVVSLDIFWGQTFWGSTFVEGQQILRVKQFWWSTNVGGPHFLGVKISMVKHIWGSLL